MKTLATILVVTVVLSCGASTPADASPSWRIHSFQSVMAFIQNYIAPYSFGLFAPTENVPIGSGSREWVGGDADDQADGRIDFIGKGSREDMLQSGLTLEDNSVIPECAIPVGRR